MGLLQLILGLLQALLCMGNVPGVAMSLGFLQLLLALRDLVSFLDDAVFQVKHITFALCGETSLCAVSAHFIQCGLQTGRAIALAMLSGEFQPVFDLALFGRTT